MSHVALVQKIKIIEKRVNLQDFHLILMLVQDIYTHTFIIVNSHSLDFSKLFNWNTKQIFVTVVADYETDKYVRIQLYKTLY